VLKLHKSQRIAAILKILTDSPSKVFTLGHFTEMFGVAKSTISEDIDTVRDLLLKTDQGYIDTIPGASGGIRYVPVLSQAKISKLLNKLCIELSEKERILSGGFIYMLDIIYNPEKADEIGRIFASYFFNKNIDYVITVETKGILLAFSTAKLLNIPLVIVRHYSEAADGASVNINYISGTSSRLQTMILPLKALKRNSRLLFIDDFMKGGGTAKGIKELAKQFECTVEGIGVLVSTSEPSAKLVDDYISLLTLKSVEERNGIINIVPNANY